MNIFKRIAAMMLVPLMALSMLASSVSASEREAEEVIPIAEKTDVAGIEGKCKSAILMEAGPGTILYEYNADQQMPPASVTKIMTLLLVMEAMEDGRISLDDKVTASAHAASMGGSQIYLKEGEIMSVEDMVKSVVISSANDAACALAEFVSGSEEAFVDQMNKRAAELGMKNTTFENTNGLDDTAQNHLTSARDIAIMSRELIKHKKILEYSSIWMDTVRNGLFGLTNTNRLVRYYRGCTGLKTGSTAKAGFCISATAERDGMSLICVIMGSSTRDERNAAATALLDWGFANYAVYTHTPKELDPIRVKGGSASSVPIKYDGFSTVTNKSDASKISYRVELDEDVSAPVKKGDKVGEIVFERNGDTVGKRDVYADGDVDKISFFELWYRILAKFLLK